MKDATDASPLIRAAADALRRGDVIGLPTETVYGLAADARNATAVAKIFALKGRPATNPLIVHVANEASAQRYAADWPEAAAKLAAAFWPGPLTIVVRKAANIPAIVTAGGDTVGLRVPAHPLAIELLKAFDGPLAAPSANRSNHVSPTAAQHVRDEFGDAVPIVLDGGPCQVGIESTVVDVTGERWKVLRPGQITAEMIAAILPPLPLREGVGGGDSRYSAKSAAVPNSQPSTAEPLPLPPPSRGGGEEILRSPGQLDVHYAPRTPAFRFEARQRPSIDATNAAIIEPTLDPDTYARNLYARLRLLDAQDLRAIYIELPPDRPEWRAVRDRLLRATRPLPETP